MLAPSATAIEPALREPKASIGLAVCVFVKAWWSVHPIRLRQAARLVPATKPKWGSRSTRTCSGMPAATRWPISASIPDRPIWAIAPSTRPLAMPRWRRGGLRTLGGRRAYSQTWCSSFSPKSLRAVELTSDRSILGNASQVGGRCTGYASPGCAAPDRGSSFDDPALR
jgi:hypothetical protein